MINIPIHLRFFTCIADIYHFIEVLFYASMYVIIIFNLIGYSVYITIETLLMHSVASIESQFTHFMMLHKARTVPESPGI